MVAEQGFHKGKGSLDFLGVRPSRCGGAEIVYDDGAARRMIWRVIDREIDPVVLREVLQKAVSQSRVVPALYAQLRERAIAVEVAGL